MNFSIPFDCIGKGLIIINLPWFFFAYNFLIANRAFFFKNRNLFHIFRTSYLYNDKTIFQLWFVYKNYGLVDRKD